MTSSALICVLACSAVSVRAANDRLLDDKLTPTLHYGHVPQDAEAPWSVIVFGGRMSNDNLGDVVNLAHSDFADIYFGGVAVSRQIYRWRFLSLELEGGAGLQFSDSPGNTSPQIWAAAVFRYDYFPWNHFIHTTVAVTTGLNFSFRETAFEKAGGTNGDTSRLQHYFSPEITFALPQHRNKEVVLRIHHRSAVFGLFGCRKCGSNILTLGFRMRF